MLEYPCGLVHIEKDGTEWWNIVYLYKVERMAVLYPWVKARKTRGVGYSTGAWRKLGPSRCQVSGGLASSSGPAAVGAGCWAPRKQYVWNITFLFLFRKEYVEYETCRINRLLCNENSSNLNCVFHWFTFPVLWESWIYFRFENKVLKNFHLLQIWALYLDSVEIRSNLRRSIFQTRIKNWKTSEESCCD